MSHKNRKGRAEEGLEEGRVEVDNREDPVERIYYVPDNFEHSIELFPVFTDNYHAMFCQDIVKQFEYFLKAEFLNKVLDIK